MSHLLFANRRRRLLATAAVLVPSLLACGARPDASGQVAGANPPPAASSEPAGGARTEADPTTTTPAGTSLPSGTTGRTSRVPTTTAVAKGPAAITLESVVESQGISSDFGQRTINGVEFTEALNMRTSSTTGRLEINLGRRPQGRFRGVLGVPDDQKSAAAFKVEISLDSAAPVYTTDVKFGESKEIDIDVAEALRLKIKTTPNTCCHVLAIGDPRIEV